VSSPRSRITTLARHEYRAAARSRVLVSLLAILVVVTTVSVYIGAADYRSQLADYQAYKAAAKAGGVQHIAPPPLALLSLLRGALEYVEIIGAVIAIALGYLSVSRERTSGTMPLIRSRPVSAGELAAGSALGAVGVISTLVALTAVAAVLCLGLIGNQWVDHVEAFQLLLAYLAAIIYMMTFYCLSVAVARKSKVTSNGLLVALAIWLVVVLVLPQIGDTLDPDNQVPGGLFAALNLAKPQETQILAHFSFYETIRTGIEAASLEKHFERFAFAMIDVKPADRGLTLTHLLSTKSIEIEWLVAYAAALGFAFRRSFGRRSKTSRSNAPEAPPSPKHTQTRKDTSCPATTGH